MDVPALGWCHVETALNLYRTFLAAPGLLLFEAQNARLRAAIEFGRKAS